MLPILKLSDNGLRNVLRRVPPNAFVYLPGLEVSGTSIRDYSGSNNNGTITGATWDRAPGGAPVLNFANNNAYKVDCGNPNAVVNTFMFWFYNNVLIDKASAADGMFAWSATVGLSSGDTTAGLANEILTLSDAGAGNERTGWCDASAQLAVGWHHLALVWNAGDARYDMIVDGTLYATTAAVAGHVARTTTSALKLGQSNYDDGFNGKQGVWFTSATVYTLAQVQYYYNLQRRFFGV